MPLQEPFAQTRFPRTARYNPEWIVAGASGGAHALWLVEWLTEALRLERGMRVLDLGSGRGTTSVFLHREFGVQVWATDLWFDPGERAARFRDAAVADAVFAVHADARALPFAPAFFDAVVSIDAYPYFGTDDLYLGYLARFLKPGAPIGIAGAGLLREVDETPPDHLVAWWEPSLACLHTPAWWRRHWARSGLVSVDVADSLADGWRYWLDWQRTVAPHNTPEIEALEVDQGRTLGYVRTIARRRLDREPDEHIVAVPTIYEPHPVMRPHNG
jgi:SAM-dependent methyltransferase